MSEAERAKVRTAAREAAALEGRVALMVRMLATVVDETVANVEKKQARTYDELQAELEEAEEVRPVLPQPLTSPPRPVRDETQFSIPLLKNLTLFLG